MKALALKTIEAVVDQVDVAVSAMTRPGDRAPVVFLHGFGSTKEDYADTARQEPLPDADSWPTTHRAVEPRRAPTWAPCRSTFWSRLPRASWTAKESIGFISSDARWAG
ncbi:hypothetical protein [Aeromicrobium sp. UC242_57]|uniref:hypothetical protein n=1 Tax=Aeromicrobium sp. UC242_57 TaxID=3374624 RepID=UPI0037A74410